MVCIYYSLLIHSSVNEDLKCFHDLDLVNNAAINNGIKYLFQILLSIVWGIYSELLYHMVILF